MFSRLIKILLFALIGALPIASFSQVVAKFSTDVVKGCIPLPIVYLNESTENNQPIDKSKYNFVWEMGDNQNSEKKDTVNALYSKGGKKTITLKIINKLDKSLVNSVTIPNLIEVFSNPAVHASVQKNPTCIDDEITFTPIIDSSSSPIASWTWDFGDGSSFGTSQTVVHSYNKQATYSAKVFATDQNGCTTMKTNAKPISIIINSTRPTADFTIDKAQTCDSILKVTLTNKSTAPANVNIIGFKWYYNDKTSDSTKNVSDVVSKTFTRKTNTDIKSIFLTAIADNGCSSYPQKKEVTLYKLDPKITISDDVKQIISPAMACQGNISFSTEYESDNSYKWDIGSNGSIESTSSSFSSNSLPVGPNSVSLTVTNPACSAQVSTNFNIEPTPQFEYAPKGTFDCGLSVSKSFTPIKMNVDIDSIFWHVVELKDTLFSRSKGFEQSKAFNFIADGDYTIKANILTTNGCKATFTYPKITKVYYPKIKLTKDTLQGCAPLKVKFKNRTTYAAPKNSDEINDSTIYFGDGTSVQNKDTVTHIYTKDGDYKPYLTINTKKGCKLTDTVIVKVGKKPIVDIEILDKVVCAGYNIIDPMKSGAKLVIKSYVLNEDGTKNIKKYDSTSSTIVHKNNQGSSSTYSSYTKYNDTITWFVNNSKYNKMGDYLIHMKEYYNGCLSDTIIDPASKKYFRIQGPISFVKNVAINCDSTFKIHIQVDSLIQASHWRWDFYAPVLNFKNEIVYKRLDSIKTNTKDTIVDFKKYNFDVGDYYVKLTSFCDTTNCLDSSSVRFTITNTKADVSLTDTMPCALKYRELTPGKMRPRDMNFLTNFSWNIKYPNGVIDSTIDDHTSYKHKHKGTGFYLYKNYAYIDKETSALSYEKIYFPERGVYTISATVEDINQCKSTKSIQIRAYQPQAGYIVDSISTCLPVRLNFKDTSKSFCPIKTREWNTNGDSLKTKTGNDLKAMERYDFAKSYSTSLTVTDTMGCTDVAEKANAVNPIVPVAKIISDTKLCLGTIATFKIDSTIGAPFKTNVDSFIWNFGDGGKDTVIRGAKFTISHFYKSEIYQPQVIVRSYITPPVGKACPNADTSKIIDIKNARGRFNLLDSTKNCDKLTFTIQKDQIKAFDSFKFEELFKESSTYKGSLNNSNLFYVITGAGYHDFRYITTSSYKGCEVDTFKHTFYIPSSTYTISPDKNKICIKDTVTFTLTAGKDTKIEHPQWFIDGYKNEKDTFKMKYSFSKLIDPKVQVSFKDGDYSCTYQTMEIYLSQIQAQFARGLNDSIIKGCVPFEIPFINKSSGKENNYVWSYSDGSTNETTANPTHVFKKPNETVTVKLSVQGTDNGTVCKDEIIKEIKTFPNPEFTHNISKPLCDGTPLTINLSTSSGTTIGSWNTDPTIQSITADNKSATVLPHSNTKYIVTAQYINVGYSPCVIHDTLLVKVQNKPTYLGAPNNYLVYLPTGQRIDTLKTKPKDQLYPFIDYSLNNTALPGVTYSWDPSEGLSCSNCPNPNINIEKDVTYYVTMVDSNSCFTIVDTLVFKTIIESNIGLPSAFSPNGDKNNDLAIPRGWGVKECLEYSIYNRWGQLVFSWVFNPADANPKGWDGTFNGQPQDADTYAWTIKYKDSKDNVQLKKGYITLLR